MTISHSGETIGSKERAGGNSGGATIGEGRQGQARKADILASVLIDFGSESRCTSIPLAQWYFGRQEGIIRCFFISVVTRP